VAEIVARVLAEAEAALSKVEAEAIDAAAPVAAGE
jgi:hypothetical protein